MMRNLPSQIYLHYDLLSASQIWQWIKSFLVFDLGFLINLLVKLFLPVYPKKKTIHMSTHYLQQPGPRTPSALKEEIAKAKAGEDRLSALVTTSATAVIEIESKM